MLERVWRKGNPLTLLVGMQTGTSKLLSCQLCSHPNHIPYIGMDSEDISFTYTIRSCNTTIFEKLGVNYKPEVVLRLSQGNWGPQF